MKNKVLKTIAFIVGMVWIFTACALDDEVYGMTMFGINAFCTAYLGLFSWANNWWEDYTHDDECKDCVYRLSHRRNRRAV